ncbi:MAG TPA: hypothetical protein VFQ61_25425, partial [Polyangiaceae bacterium]|nr:hypothetical protein [Polyangiaceae bacterium]
TGGKMCTEGTTAKVLKTSAGADDYSNMWGAGIGMDFNHPPDPATKMPFDAVAAGIKGVSFDLDMPVVSSLRVEFPIPETEMHADGSAYWGATKSWPASPVSVGTNTITWDKVQQPNGTIPFNPAKLLGIQFHVPTNTSAATPYSFCISNLKLIK